MSAKPFTWYELRTTDTRAAEEFYADVLDVPFRGSDVLGLAPLPERARANGAPPHWLGHIGVDDVEAFVARFVALGATALGPMQRGGDGVTTAVLRDPLGAIVAVEPRPGIARPAVLWHQLHTTDRERAWSAYAELFEWTARETWESGSDTGAMQTFAWDPSGPIVGGMANTARAPQVHTHWLFFFGVADLDVALAKVRARGEVVTAGQLPNGDRVAACHDPQGGAFGLRTRIGRP